MNGCQRPIKAGLLALDRTRNAKMRIRPHSATLGGRVGCIWK